MTPIITDALTVVTQITRQDGHLVVVPVSPVETEHQLDALRIASEIGQRRIAAIATAEQDAFQLKVANHTPALG